MFCVQLSKPRDNFIEQKMHLLHCICAILFYQSMYNISRYAPKQFPQNYSLYLRNGIQGGNLSPSDFPTDSMYVSQPF